MRQFKILERLTPRTTRASSSYLNDVERIQMVSPEKEAELGFLAKNGDTVARDQLVTANLRFVLSVAKMYAHSPEDYGDLVAAGNVGLVDAATKFDPSKGFKFISYAVWHIRKEMLAHLSDNSRLVRIPINQINTIKAMMDTAGNMSAHEGRNIDFEEAFDIVKNSKEKFNRIRPDVLKKAISADIRPASFNNPLSSDSNDTLIDIYDGRSESPDKEVIEKDVQKMLQTLAGELPPQYAEIVMRRHGIPGYAEEPESFGIIGEDIGLTSEAVRIRYMKALKVMKIKARRHNYKLSDIF